MTGGAMVPEFETRQLGAAADAVAPDGSEVRLLLALPAGSVAHFALPPGAVSQAVRHRSVSEIWYFLSGTGSMWRSRPGTVSEVEVRAGTSVTIPVGTTFQFRSTSGEPLTAVAVTMPPWPGAGEAELVAGGPWTPTLEPGPA